MVKTPSYWKEEQYQPLIEETTYYGNPVLIPKRLHLSWKFRKDIMLRMGEQYGQEKAVGYVENHIPRGKIARDMSRVFLEKYEE